MDTPNDKRMVFLKDMNCFAEEVEVTVTFSEPWMADRLLGALGDETLARLMETQVAHENYEGAGMLKRYMDTRMSSRP